MSQTLTEPTRTSAVATRDPLRDVIESLSQRRGLVAGNDPRLSEIIKELADEAKKLEQVDDPKFRTRVAFALQDFNRLAGPIGMPENIRNEMDRLAASVPDLQNTKLQDLMREVGGLSDRKLITDIRRAAWVIADQGGDQNRAELAGRVDALEQRFIASSPAAGVPRNTEPATRAAPENQNPPSPAPKRPRADERLQVSASPGDGTGTPRPAEAAAPAADATVTRYTPAQRTAGTSQQEQPAQETAQVRGAGMMGRIMTAMAPPAAASRAPWEPPPTPITDRVASFLDKFNDGKTVERAEVSGQRAAVALKSFSEGVGASIMNRINDAARTEPQGIQGVLSEMREGGRHADLRAAFNNAVSTEKNFGASHDAATTAMKQYGEARQAAEIVVLKQPAGSALAGRFERLDAAIGEAAANVPSRQEGRAVMDELGQKVADLVRRATQSVRAMFAPEPRGATTSSGPSASP